MAVSPRTHLRQDEWLTRHAVQRCPSADSRLNCACPTLSDPVEDCRAGLVIWFVYLICLQSCCQGRPSQHIDTHVHNSAQWLEHPLHQPTELTEMSVKLQQEQPGTIHVRGPDHDSLHTAAIPDCRVGS